MLRQFFDSMFENLGPQHWWPARTRLEIILGAILTQNTSWQNAARALKKLRQAGLLALTRLKSARLSEIEAHIRPAGFFRQKARTIRNFLDWLEGKSAGSLNTVFNRPGGDLRRELLGIKGLGPETVDAIMLYAAGQPHFIADAYTRRILNRHGLLAEEAGYSLAQQFLHAHLPADPKMFNEYHALLVEVGKRHCRRSEPICRGCPLEGFLTDSRVPPFRNGRNELGAQESRAESF